jgi:hypothetical protein
VYYTSHLFSFYPSPLYFVLCSAGAQRKVYAQVEENYHVGTLCNQTYVRHCVVFFVNQCVDLTWGLQRRLMRKYLYVECTFRPASDWCIHSVLPTRTAARASTVLLFRQSMSGLFALPPEILTRIFGLLEGRQITRCSTVSPRPFSLFFIPEF